LVAFRCEEIGSTLRRVRGRVDVVIVSYNSAESLRAAVTGVLNLAGVTVIVADNASRDDSLGVIADLDVVALPLEHNGGFAAGCNAGWRAGASDYVLLVNPDAEIDAAALEVLVDVLEREPGVGAVGPRIVGLDGSLEYSQRRFPRLISTFAQALFLHRFFPRAAWVDELVRDPAAYEAAGSPDWLSGACLLLRRSVLEALDGLDEGFFMYGEDVDLCKRVRDAGYDLRYDPSAVVVHEGGASAPRPTLFPVLAASRLRYARKHTPRAAPFVRLGIALGELTHILLSSGGSAGRIGHARALQRVLSAR
jgi:GT2 family glycosyltransferase